MRHRISMALAVAAVCALPLSAAPAAADGQRFALVIQGASGEPAYAELHRAWLNRLVAALKGRLKFDPSRMVVLAEEPGTGEERSTAENVRTAIGRFAKEMKADDLLFVMLIGHGGGEGADAKFNLIGPDLSIPDWNSLLKPIAGRIALVDATSSSFPYLAGLSGPGRIVVTATNSFAQRYHTVFADAFIQALEGTASDADKNGRVSILEAFEFASRTVADHYAQAKRLSTETALLDDNGDGAGREATTKGPDGVVAGTTYLDVYEVPKVADPQMQALLIRRQELTDEVDSLRRKRSEMAPADFDREFEKVIIELALVSREIRRKGAFAAWLEAGSLDPAIRRD